MDEFSLTDVGYSQQAALCEQLKLFRQNIVAKLCPHQFWAIYFQVAAVLTE